ncbi:Phosphotransferase enzyme family protein [Mesobacillus persicus]|uniref:Phosphotransferase enzyme family protein n=2 Tax=Mesobacillus persicus TaxID=930146 RepID=A0A1H7XEY8_9BACI|nr:Phosphotransferase enzyme family protein [Mesobacillus persicus]
MECLEMTKTKAMNINFYPGRDDFIDRLFSFLTLKLPFEIHQLTRIRDHVYLVEASQVTFILKGYLDLSKLALQQDFTAALKKAGFEETYCFFNFIESPLYFENRYWGCIEYLVPNRRPFTFKSQAEREEGLQLVSEYHSITKGLVSSYGSLLSKQDLLRKWKQRLKLFKKNLSIVHYYVPKEITKEIIMWAELALAGMENNQANFTTQDQVILHGDVAHHNFLRLATGELYLIDFDLVSVGPKRYDLLQYANRILPFMHWSLKSLFKMNGLTEYVNDQSFLYGLMYPSDIFREWNRIIKLNSYYDPTKVSTLMELTVNQFPQRKKFIENTMTLIDL